MRSQTLRMLAVGASTLCAGAVHAEIGDQLFKLLAEEANSGGFLGFSVGIDGSIAVAGAPYYRNDGSTVGAAILFSTVTGQQLRALVSDDGVSSSDFAQAVAISGSTVIVGAQSDDDNGPNAGAAYLFDATTGQQLYKLFADDGGPTDNFGVSVAISGDTAIIGADFDDDGGLDAGAAYLFDVATGQQLFKLTTNDIMPADHLGVSVGIDGDIAIVGAYWDDDNGLQSGSAYLFDVTTGQQLFKLVPDDGFELDWFGVSVAISGSVAIVGASGDDDSGTNSGSAYLYDTTTGQLLFKLLANEALFSDDFGWAVAISGSTAMVGAWDAFDVFINGDRIGAAYFFDTSTGQQTARFLATDGERLDYFGYSVAISGTTAIAGAWGSEESVFGGEGAAYLFAATDCFMDLNNDGAIDTADLGILLGQFGTPGPGADLNNDGVVDTADLGILLGEFGGACL